MSLIIKTDDEGAQSQMRSNMRNEMRRMYNSRHWDGYRGDGHGGRTYEDGYREGYKHGYEDCDEDGKDDDEGYRRSRSRNRYM